MDQPTEERDCYHSPSIGPFIHYPLHAVEFTPIGCVVVVSTSHLVLLSQQPTVGSLFFFVHSVNHVPCHTSLRLRILLPHLTPTRLKFGCTTLCAHVERALELFLPTRFRQTIRDRGTDDSRYPQRPDNPQVTAAMRYIHSQEILEIPEGGTFHHFPFFF